jgi:hypothetical protein
MTDDILAQLGVRTSETEDEEQEDRLPDKFFNTFVHCTTYNDDNQFKLSLSYDLFDTKYSCRTLAIALYSVIITGTHVTGHAAWPMSRCILQVAYWSVVGANRRI